MKSNDLYLGIVNDAMNQLGFTYHDYYIDIKPLAGYDTLIHGPAFTTYGEVVDQDIDYSSLDNIRLEMYKPSYFSNNPVVVLQSNDNKVAHSGDLTSKIYQKLGAVGFVTDGIVRDIEIINSIKFPVFAESNNPIDAINFWALTKYQIDIEIKGIKIRPGDYLFCSGDGVIVCKQELYNDLLKIMNEVYEKESRVRSSIDILSPKDLYTSLKELVETGGRW